MDSDREIAVPAAAVDLALPIFKSRIAVLRLHETDRPHQLYDIFKPKLTLFLLPNGRHFGKPH